MKSNEIRTLKEFKNVANNAAKEVNELVFSPFAIVNTLNAIATGKESKYLKELVNSGYSVESVKTLAQIVRKTHKGRYAFDVSLFATDSAKRFCTLATSKKCPKYGMDLYNVSEKGFTYYKPVKCTFGAFVRAFYSVAAPYIKAIQNEESEKAKAAKRAERAANKIAAKAAKAKGNKELVTKYFGNAAENYTIEEITKKAALLRKLYGKAA